MDRQPPARLRTHTGFRCRRFALLAMAAWLNAAALSGQSPGAGMPKVVLPDRTVHIL